jgi:hypothetical protein
VKAVSAGSGLRSLSDRLKTRASLWVRRHLVADDPHPEASRLDRMDGVGLSALERLRHQQQEAEGTGNESDRGLRAYPGHQESVNKAL